MKFCCMYYPTDRTSRGRCGIKICLAW